MLGEEVPYATTVAIDRFEQEGALRRIHATVHVDRENQRAILRHLQPPATRRTDAVVRPLAR